MIHYNMVNQKSNNDCAVACLMMIFKYYNVKVKYEDLANKLKLNKEGTSAYNIVKISKKYGIKAIGYKKYDINKIKKPVIALVINKGIQHFIVIYKVKKDSIIIADPASKIMTISKSYFKKYYSGIIIKFIKNTPNKTKFFSFFCYFIINIVIIYQNLLLLYLVSKLINIIEMQNYFFIKNYIFLFILLYVIKSLFMYIRDNLSVKIKLIIDKNITLPFLFKLLSSKNYSKKKNLIDNLIGKYNDLNFIKDIYFKFISIYIINALFLIVALIFLLLIDYKVTFILIVYLVFNFIFNYIYYSKNYYKILENQIKKENYFSKINTIFSNLKNKNNFKKIKNYKRIKKDYNEYMLEYKQIEGKFIYKNFLGDIFFLFVLIITLIIVFVSESSYSNIFYIYSIIMMITNIVDDFILDLPNIMSYKAVKERLRYLI